MRELAPAPTRPRAAPLAWQAAPPVDYAEAVRRYLVQAALSPGSRRVYLISLTGWTWPMVGRPTPLGTQRRRATPPIVPLALLDDPCTGPRLAAALTERTATADARTVNRELSALRSAAGWWLDQQWIRADPTVGLRHVASHPAALPPLTREQVARLFRAVTSLREHAFWRLLHDTGAPAEDLLGLDVGRLDLLHHHARPRGAPDAGSLITWREGATQLLRWLVAGRPAGPVFITDRKAPTGANPAHVCPVTGRARMSYRRAAEIFTEATRPLDPAGKGWTFQQLRHARRRPRES